MSLDKQCESSTGLGSVTVNTGDIKTMNIHTQVTKTFNYFGSEARSLFAGNEDIPVTANEQKSPLITIQDISDLKTNLQKFYEKLTLPCITWLEEREDLSIDEYFIDLRLEFSDTIIKKEEIFNPVNQQQPSRILIEGQPGSGKTSLATRIACDWAKQKKYVNQFELVFLLPLRELQQQSVDDAIKSIGFISGFKDNDKIDDMIASNEQQILFIFDGLDELSVTDRASLLELLYERKYREATMLVTCRTGLFTLTKDERTQLFKRISMPAKFWNKQVSVLGIKNNEKKMKFLEKFIVIDESIKSNIIDNIKSTVTTNELFDCPLFLILLAFIVNTEENVGTFLTRTELYKQLFNSIIKHSYGRNEMPLDDDFDLFDCDSSPDNELHKLIKEFGKLCMRHILENNLQFKSDGLTERVYKVGFLSNHKQVIRFKSKQYYEAFHLSIVEFSAAYYAWMEYKSNVPEIKKRVLELVVHHYFRTRGTSLVLGFMIGLSQEQLRDIFDALQPYACYFSSHPYHVVRLLDEYLPADVYNNIFPFITDFMPAHLDMKMDFRNEMFGIESFEQLIEYGTKCGKVECVYNQSLIRIPRLKNLHPSIVKVTFGRIEDLRYILTHQACEVNELHINMSLFMKSNTKPSREVTSSIVSTLTSFQSCSIKLHCVDVQWTDYDETVFQLPFYFFRITITTREEELFTIALLQRTKVTLLQVVLASDHTDLRDLFDAIANSSSLVYFTFSSENGETVIDLSDLTNGGTKTYEYLGFNNCIVTCRQPLINKQCIKILSLDGATRDTLFEIEPVNLKCMIADVEELLEMNPTWCGINSIKYINIQHPLGNVYQPFANIHVPSYSKYLRDRRRYVSSLPVYKIEDTRLLSFLSNCGNLGTLEISSKVFEDTHALAEGLKQLAIEKLVYKCDHLEGLNLFEIMNANWKADDQSKLQSIDILFEWKRLDLDSNIVNCILPAIFELAKGVHRRHWKRVNFVCSDKNFVLFALNDRRVIDLTLFNVVHYTYGSDHQDPDYHKLLVNHHDFRNVDAFAITRK